MVTEIDTTSSANCLIEYENEYQYEYENVEVSVGAYWGDLSQANAAVRNIWYLNLEDAAVEEFVEFKNDFACSSMTIFDLRRCSTSVSTIGDLLHQQCCCVNPTVWRKWKNIWKCNLNSCPICHHSG